MFKDVSQEQIETWKAEKGKVMCLEIGGGKVYLQDPTSLKNYFHTVKRAMFFDQQKDIISSGEVIFNECYLGGLGDLSNIDKNTPIYVNVCTHCNLLIDVMTGNFTIV